MANKPVHTFRRSPSVGLLKQFVEAEEVPASPSLAPVPEVALAEPMSAEVETITAAELLGDEADAPAAASPPAEPADRNDSASAVSLVREPASPPRAKAPKAPRAPAASQVAGARASINRTDGRQLMKVSVYLDVTLAKKLRVQSAAEDIDMSTIVGDALEAHFSK